jgi:hypothetical protein
MRSRLCSRLRLDDANVRTAGDYAGTIGHDNTVGAGTVRIHPFFLFDRPLFDGLTLDLSLIDLSLIDWHVAHAVAAKDDDAAAAGRPSGRTEGGHDRPFGVSIAPPACGHALRL